jgi:glycosyltransferase involved in cell wall biosynthesis
MMKIALITDGIWPYVLGGMQKHSYYLCKYLAQNQIQVDLVHFNRSSYDIERLEFFSEDEKKFIKSILIDFPTGGSMPGHYIRNSYLHSQLIFEAIQHNLQTYDFIYTKGFTGWQMIELKALGKIKSPPIGVNFHGYEMFQRAPNIKSYLSYVFLLRKPVREISKKADFVFSYGGKITEIISNLGIEYSRIIELPSGVEKSVLAQKINPCGKKIKFLFLGRYERRKGIEELTAALQIQKEGDFEFHFVGPIPSQKQLKKNNVIYHGEIRDREKLTQTIRNCDVLFCPSWSEGMPNVILEAMAAGLAVAATNVGATNVLVNDHTGWLIKESNEKNIAAVFTSILHSTSSEIDRKKENALQLLQNKFVWEKLIQDFLRQLQKIAK